MSLTRKVFNKFSISFYFNFSIHLVRGHIPLTFLNHSLVAVRYLLGTPASYVLRRWIKWQHFVQHLMVEHALDAMLYLTEIHHHAIFIQFLRPTINRDFPIMSVQMPAFALIVELQPMSRRYFDGLFYIIHVAKIFNFLFYYLIAAIRFRPQHYRPISWPTCCALPASP